MYVPLLSTVRVAVHVSRCASLLLSTGPLRGWRRSARCERAGQRRCFGRVKLSVPWRELEGGRGGSSELLGLAIEVWINVAIHNDLSCSLWAGYQSAISASSIERPLFILWNGLGGWPHPNIIEKVCYVDGLGCGFPCLLEASGCNQLQTRESSGSLWISCKLGADSSFFPFSMTRTIPLLSCPCRTRRWLWKDAGDDL